MEGLIFLEKPFGYLTGLVVFERRLQSTMSRLSSSSPGEVGPSSGDDSGMSSLPLEEEVHEGEGRWQYLEPERCLLAESDLERSVDHFILRSCKLEDFSLSE